MRWLFLVAVVIASISTFVLISDEMEEIRDDVLTIEYTLDITNDRLNIMNQLLEKLGDDAVSLDIHINELIDVIRTEWMDIKNMEDKVKGIRYNARYLPAELPDDEAVYREWLMYKESFE